MKYEVKPFEVPRRGRPRQEVATARPKSQKVFTLEAKSDSEVRALIRERYRQQGRTIRSLSAMTKSQYVVYVEAK